MKAVLVVDIRACGDCPCSGEEFGMCQAVNNEKECDYYNIPSWCPLRPLPQKLKDWQYADKYNRWGVSQKDIQKEIIGYNLCIDEITGDHIGDNTEKVGETE